MSSKAPDLINTITAFRNWKWTKEGLQSWGAFEKSWTHGMEAVCLAHEYEDHQTHNHSVPFRGCTCGFYTTFDIMSAVAEPQSKSLFVVGVCKVWGKIEVHQHGLRSQFISPYAVFVDKRQQKHAPDLYADLSDWCEQNNFGLAQNVDELKSFNKRPLPEDFKL